MKALVGAFNQEKALVGAFSMIVQPVVEPMERYLAPLSTLNFGLGSNFFIATRFTARLLGAAFNEVFSGTDNSAQLNTFLIYYGDKNTVST